MDASNLTLKSREALQQAQQLAAARNHQTVEPLHVLHALLSDAEGVVYPLIHTLGTSPRAIRDRVEEHLDATSTFRPSTCFTRCCARGQ